MIKKIETVFRFSMLPARLPNPPHLLTAFAGMSCINCNLHYIKVIFVQTRLRMMRSKTHDLSV